MAPAKIKVEVIYSPGPRQIISRVVELPVGSTVAEALAASELAVAQAVLQAAPLSLNGTVAEDLTEHPPSKAFSPVGIWGIKARLDDRLADQDRLEIYRALHVDPKEARRLRYNQQRPSTARRRLVK